MNYDTVAAISTARGEGGIGVIRISGDDAAAVADKVFVSASGKKLCDMKGYTATFGKIEENGEYIDEAVALVFKKPHSYTGENVVELSCHGGLYVTERVLRAVLDSGAAPAPAGEFTKRAFLNGKLGLTEAEAVMDIIGAKSRAAARSALSVKEGALRRRTDAVKDELLDLAAHLSAWADYPDEDIEEITSEDVKRVCKSAEEQLIDLLDGYDRGQTVKNGIDTVIAGSPNVGKSTLMNLLSGSDKSIVTEIPGTTRDIVENTVVAGSVTLNLSDTAGLRTTDDAVEKIGVDKAKRRMKSCALLLAVFDNGRVLSDNDRNLIETAKNVPSVAVINKTDLNTQIDVDYIRQNIKNTVFVSAINGEGKNELISAIERAADTSDFNPCEGVLSNERQRSAAEEALKSVKETLSAAESGMTLDALTVLTEEAISCLMELTGEKTSDEVVDRVFHSFCVGK